MVVDLLPLRNPIVQALTEHLCFDQSIKRFIARVENEVNAGKRHCRIGKITKKHEPGAVVFLNT